MTVVTDPFTFLHETINVLVIDPAVAAGTLPIHRLLASMPCCRVDYAATNTEALVLLRSGRRFHVCITELGMYDSENDEYVILRHYADHCSIVILTAEQSAAKGAHAVWLGARAVFDKVDQFDQREFMQVFGRMVLINVVNCRFNEWSGDTLNSATAILFEKNPVSVTEWADYMRITDRQLRNLWHSGSGFGAKQMLFLYGCLRNAFGYYESCYFSTHSPSHAVELFFRKQYERYYTAHRDILLFLLS